MTNRRFTPLNIYNGTPKGVSKDAKGQLLLINQLKGADIEDVRANSNVHRCNLIHVCKYLLA